jgi:hypothetical protein
MADPNPIDPQKVFAEQFKDLRKQLRDLQKLTGTQKYQAVERLQEGLADLKANLPTLVADLTYTKSQVDTKLATKVGTADTIPQARIGADGATQGQITATGDVTGQRAIFPTGVRSTGARANVVTTNYVAAYLDANGNLGYAPSTAASKNILGPFQVDMAKWLALPLYRFVYKDDPEARPVVGPLADDLHAAGLSEFVVYDETGNIQGVRTETLLIGLWSAYVQSRTATMGRIANQMYQTYTESSMTALGLNAEKTYTVTWPKPFVDAQYLVSPTVTSSGLALTAVASVVPGSQTATGCKVSVRTLGLALASGATLTVQAVHI